LQFSGASATIDVSTLGAAYTDVDFKTGGAVTVTNNNSTIHLSDSTGSGLGALSITEATGQHTLNYDLTSSATSGASDAGVTLAGGISTIDLSSNGTFSGGNTFGGGGVGVTGAGTAVDNLIVNITGTDALTLGQFHPVTIGETINAGSFSGGLTYTSSGLGDIITGGTGKDVLTLSTPTGATPLGDQVTLNSAAASIILQPSAAGDATGTGFETVTHFTAGGDVYKAAPADTVAASFFTTTANVNGAANLAAAASAAMANAITFGGFADPTHSVLQFTFNGGTFDLINQGAAGAGYVAGTDTIVKEVGLVGTHTGHDFLLS
jgi:hypothetical protein